MIHNIFSVSGGKDSTATLLFGQALETQNMSGVFADTGNEHQQTYDYVDYLEQATGIEIRRVKADFSEQIARKKERINTKWREKGISDYIVDRAISILVPSGNPYLDLCLWKGRFPSSQAQFCTQELKVFPIIEQVFFPITDKGDIVWSWQGVRRDESLNRRYVPEFEDMGGGIFNYRPIAKWPALATFEAMAYMGIKPNPLYSQGNDRVGCMPCINCSKKELHNIAARYPDAIDRIFEWESLVSMASKRGSATFFCATNDPTVKADNLIEYQTHGIRRMVEWSKTMRGGRKLDLFGIKDGSTECASSYGLCE
ncbi:phosphoadenosine phosphosulfate reductase family protein [Agitococcus lubricus]|uniref:3'-phosphoadenosine 5'-phosphosulfate sulfotransferase (PAPS reductase)/FAD synthetase n=1 Tax=Agitococcus lubricus TaxID=1077255 RepID=A0A2T5IRV9_9GAMM|nr:phosphoadenosine phosphosulfate reductase family protein [Agitococcus lubricus]PTQ86554.1 3'-phosphoadenosine 5'-phosphosulfate sulfotransferase (PAPS reductase)/FAD synthetase [Agitococcus lubricus]